MVICSIVSLILFKTKLKRSPSDSNVDSNGEQIPKTKFSSLLKIPALIFSCVNLGISGISCTWYLPTLQVSLVELQNIHGF